MLLKRREIAYHLKDAEAKAYFCFQGTPQLPMGDEGWAGFNEVDSCKKFWLITADPAVPSPIEGTTTLGRMMADQKPTFETAQTDALDTAVILYTSGTTGQPKGAGLSHSNMVMNALSTRDLMKHKNDDVELIVLPLFHSFGQTVQMNAGFLSGHTLVLLACFEPGAVFQALQDEDVSIFCGVPTMFWALLNSPDADKFDLEKIASMLRIGTSGGASLPVEVIKGFEVRFNIPLLEGYGLSETSPVASFGHLDKPRKPGSIGVPIWGVEMRVVDADDKPVPMGERGEIIMRGHNVIGGYKPLGHRTIYSRPVCDNQILPSLFIPQ